MSVWGHYMGLNDFTKSLLSQYFQKENEIKNIEATEKNYYKYISEIIEKKQKNEELTDEEKKYIMKKK